MNSLGEHVIRLKEVDSTQNELKQRIVAKEASEGSLVVATSQSRGRGMLENAWESEPGANLLFSFMWVPDFLPVSSQFMLTKTVSLAMADFVASIVPEKKVRIKWPNDIYVDDRKIAGILIENSIMGGTFQYSVIGIGLNVNQCDFSPSLPNPVSLCQLTSLPLRLDDCLEQICTMLKIRYSQLKSDHSTLNNDYLSALYRINTIADFHYQGKVITAKIFGVSEFGMLQLQQQDGAFIECDLKTIQYIV